MKKKKKKLNLLVFFNERANFLEAVMSMHLLCYVLHFLDFMLPTYIAIARVGADLSSGPVFSTKRAQLAVLWEMHQECSPHHHFFFHLDFVLLTPQTKLLT